MVAKLMIRFSMILILAMACGTAEAPDSTAAPAAEPTSAPVAGETSQPTPVPQVAAPPADVEVNPGKLTIMVGDLLNERFDPVFANAPGSHNYFRIAHGYLISTNEKTELVPGIASNWEISSDGLTWTFTIREGVKWHEGTELVPEDVLWSLQHMVGPQAFEYTTGSLAGISRAMERIELSGPDTVSMTTTVPFTTFYIIVSEASNSSYPVMPKRATLRDEAEELAYDSNPIGAGFMRLTNHVPASVMSFERFDDFYYQPKNGFPEDKRVNFQTLEMFLVPEESIRVAALRAAEADIAPVSLASRKQVEAGGGGLVFGPEGVVVEARLMGCFEPQRPCHDKRVRQALDYAIDKELMRDTLFGGPEVFQVKGWSLVTPSTIGYTPELDPWPFDPDKARQLLADAGYPNGEGFGKLIVNTWPASSMPLQVEVAQLVADNWRRELELDVEVRAGDSTGVKKMEVAGELNGQILWREQETRRDATSGTNSKYADPENIVRVHDDPELLRLVQETIQIVDSDERAEASKMLYQRLRDESYQLGIGYVNIPWGVGPRVLTWQPYPLATWPSALHTITLE